MVGRILSKVDGTLTVTVESVFLLPDTELYNISLPASTAAMYSASEVDSATVFCNLDYHETAPPAYVITYPDVDRLVSTSADMSESVKPSS